MPRLTVKQRLAGKTQAFEVTVRLSILHQSERDARGYIDTMIGEWSAKGRIIPCYKVLETTESDTLFTHPDSNQVREYDE